MTLVRQATETMPVSRKQPFRYRRVPRRRVRMHALLWLVIGFSVVTTVVSGWAIVVQRGSLPSHSNFVGQLSPDADPVVIHIPKGAIIKEVHVQRNAQLEQGQTVATLDIAAMKRRILEIKAELLHADMLRECLLLEEVPQAAYFVDLPEVAQTQARLARQECETFLAKKQLILAELESAKQLKAQERRLVERYISVLASGMRQDMKPEKREADSRQALALAMLRNQLDQEIADLEFGAEKDGAEWQKTRLAQIKSLGEVLRAQEEMKHHMQRLLERPRLQAPKSGLVVQVRNVPQDSAMYEDVDFLVLRPEDGVGYNASFVVPHAQLDEVEVGSKVHMTMLGMTDGGPTLTGIVSALNTTARPAVRASVELDAESVMQLDSPEIGVALRGLGTASVIRVQKENLNAVNVLERVLRSAFLVPGEPWFWTRLLPEHAGKMQDVLAMVRD